MQRIKMYKYIDVKIKKTNYPQHLLTRSLPLKPHQGFLLLSQFLWSGSVGERASLNVSSNDVLVS